MFLVFVTHALLDAFTAYGTQFAVGRWRSIRWRGPPCSLSTPAYTLPLIVGIVAALVMTRQTDRGHRINQVCPRCQHHLSALDHRCQDLGPMMCSPRSLADQGIAFDAMFTTPTPFNTLLWRGRRDRCRWVLRRVLFRTRTMTRMSYSNTTAARNHCSTASATTGRLHRLKWFSKGFYTVDRVGRTRS